MFTGEAVNPSYQGFPPDLTGFTFVVTYSDNSTREIRDVRELQIFPPVLVAWINPVTGGNPNFTAGEVVPHRHFEVRYGAAVAGRPLEIPASLTRLLIREDGMTGDLHNEFFWSAEGFHMHGVNQMQDTYYVDDTPNFARLTGEAHFAVPSTTAPGGVGPIRTVREFGLTEANRWGGIHGVIQPRYDATPRSETGTGVFFVTFARNPWFEAQRSVGNQRVVSNGAHPWRDRWFGDMTIPGGVNYNNMIPDPGLTALAPLREVYHVHGITFNQAPVIPAMFYWEPHLWSQLDTAPARPVGADPWTAAQLDAERWITLAHEQGVTFNVTYSNGRTYVRTLDFLMNAPDVWWNVYNDAGDLIAPADRSGARPFWVGGLIRDASPTFDHPDGTTLARNLARDPAGWGPNGAGVQELTFNYRGWYVSQPIVVWNLLTNFVARIADGSDRLEVDMTFAAQDNDNIPADGGATAAGFANRIVVEATWVERSNPDNTNVVVLTYNNLVSRAWRVDDTVVGLPALEPNFAYISAPITPLLGLTNANVGRTFFMDFGEIGVPGRDAWGHAFLAENNNLNGNVTIWYASPWVRGEPDAPADDGWIDDNLNRETGTAGQWQLYGTESINVAHDAEGWWWSRLGELRVATVPVTWRNIQ